MLPRDWTHYPKMTLFQRCMPRNRSQLYSWDITELHGPSKWTYFYLYVILDVYSRYLVGWMVAHRESATLVEKLIAQTCECQRIKPNELTVHADRGSSMTSKASLPARQPRRDEDHSRPHVSSDNPFSEAAFKTLKYRPRFPGKFGSIVDARGFCGDFSRWYNEEHPHSALGLLTPYDVHHGLAAQRLSALATVLQVAFSAHPERFVKGAPVVAQLPTEVWINRPTNLDENLEVR